MFQLDDGLWGLSCHIVYGILVSKPVGSLHGIIHMPPPIILMHATRNVSGPESMNRISVERLLPKCGIDSSLGGNGMTPCREELRYTGRIESSLRQTKRRAKAGSSGTDHQCIIFVILT